MQNASTDHNRPGGLHMPTGDTTSTSSASTESRGSPRPTPLTPHNTFDFGFAEPSDELLDHVETTRNASDDESDSADSISLVESSSPDSDEITGRNTSGHRRTASMPPPGLKRASTVPFSRDRQDVFTAQKKAAHFADNVGTSHSLLRRTISEHRCPRRKCAPADNTANRVFFLHGSSSDDGYAGSTLDSDTGDLFGPFEGVIEDLMQVAEEREEADQDLVKAAEDDGDVDLEDSIAAQDGDAEDSDRDYTQDSEHDTDNHSEEIVSFDRSSQSIADEDVDESCIATADIARADFGGVEIDRPSTAVQRREHPQPEVLFLTKEGCLKEPDLQPIAEEAAANIWSSSTETVIGPSLIKAGKMPKRRVSDSHAHSGYAITSSNVRRSASMTDCIGTQDGLRRRSLPSKATPAPCAVTVCTVRAAESPKLNTVYEHLEARSRRSSTDNRGTKTSQTVCSDTGMFQALWEESPSSSSNSAVTLFDTPAGPELMVSEWSPDTASTGSPMDRVKTKLAAWSWARENSLVDEFGKPKWIPLLSFEDDLSPSPSTSHTPRTEGPLSPPNTQRPSGASSAKPSAPGSPPDEQELHVQNDEDDEDEPIELKVKATFSRSPRIKPQRSLGGYLDIPVKQSRSAPSSPGGTEHMKAVSRQLSNLAPEEVHFKTHRDSVLLLHKKEQEERMINQQLLNSQDSIILTRTKFNERYPKTNMDKRPAWNRIRDLSPIPDASPPDARKRHGFLIMANSVGAPVLPKKTETVEDHAHPDEHVGCPICEVERPRWFEANCKKGPFM